MDADNALALYVHWPFCKAKCPYCDFNSHVRAHVDEEAWQRALLRELDHWRALLPEKRLISVFFGGGTPSLMPPRTVAAIIQRAQDYWPGEDIEITLEANPSSVEAAKFASLAAAGVNRVSLGIQALNEEALRFLGRLHDVNEALAALNLAQRYFPRVSFDLIYARPGQSLNDWSQELAQALDFGTEHISLYQLTIEPGTAFHTRHRLGEFEMPDEDLAADLYAYTQGRMQDAGLPAYEISNHARKGAESRHNLIYWQGGDYIGIGPGAHGRVRVDGQWVASEAQRLPERWLSQVEGEGHGLKPFTPITAEERAKEMLMMGLRLNQGLDLREASRLASHDMASIMDGEELLEMGLLVQDGPVLRASAEGLPILNTLLTRLIKA